jgi:4-hydroxybutyrate dehydrogenase
LNEQFKIPKTLTALGVENPDVDSLTKSALEDPSVSGNPVAMNYANTRALIEGLL